MTCDVSPVAMLIFEVDIGQMTIPDIALVLTVLWCVFRCDVVLWKLERQKCYIAQHKIKMPICTLIPFHIIRGLQCATKFSLVVTPSMYTELKCG